MTVQQMTKKPQVALMNAVHDLPVMVARDMGFFKDEGLDIAFVVTPVEVAIDSGSAKNAR